MPQVQRSLPITEARALADFYSTIDVVLTSAVAAGGNFSVPYPSGFTIQNFDTIAPLQLYRRNRNRELLCSPGDFTASFGAAAITITLSSARALESGETIMVSVGRREGSVAGEVNSYPQGALPLNAKSGKVANATAAATLASVANRTTYISGFSVTGTGATAASTVDVTVTGVANGPLTFEYTAVAGAALANPALSQSFFPPLAASGPGVDIVVSCPALGSGNTANAVVATGFNL